LKTSRTAVLQTVTDIMMLAVLGTDEKNDASYSTLINEEIWATNTVLGIHNLQINKSLNLFTNPDTFKKMKAL
jgi:hypothetical protein